MGLNIIEAARKEKRKNLTEFEAKTILQSYGIRCASGGIAQSASGALKLAQKLKSPFVLKIASPDILHKSDANCVFLDVAKDAVEGTFNKIIANARAYAPKANILGVYVQEQAQAGTEILIGMKKDPQFGPAIAFGLGGIFVEILKDVSFRIAPLSEDDISQMMQEVKGYKVLTGYRGKKPRDIGAIKNLLKKVSTIVCANPEISELDLNPVFSYEKGYCVVDARMILE